ncbi:putative Peroxidase 48 [Cucumis melo var. makuwa]|uniref:Peroxidase n=1 Tax=Cucumis melo var. makuwa TaxID=1194695 RepID=A0A5D3BEA8_CUCMM|nr:putative Peroxidase 48 [Cucumis melo var. makuwa]TYJ96785.1 putative Peroxidase 48 [Cucumis melo var. makuwa]
MLNGWVVSVVFITLLVSLCNPRGVSDIKTLDFSQTHTHALFSFLSTLQYDFYRESCPNAENIVRSSVANIYSHHHDISASLLRLFFHDCFIQGCDASILLDPITGDETYSTEKQAIPNLTLKGFHEIDQIKEELERVCPRVVSCADILSLATRDAVVLAGGPFYPVFTGRRDSTRAYFKEAMADMPRPDDSINRTLYLFATRGLDERDMVSLLGAHNIGKIGCQFILNRLYNFSGTNLPDPSIDPEFLNQMRSKCQEKENNDNSGSQDHMSPASSPVSKEASVEKLRRSTLDMSYFQELSSALSSEGGFDTHYYKSLLSGRGLLYADQQLMANEKTGRLVQGYASDDGSTFRRDFARAMVKLSVLDVLTGSQGQIRERCGY